jgi:hypothetical protein
LLAVSAIMTMMRRSAIIMTSLRPVLLLGRFSDRRS